MFIAGIGGGSGSGKTYLCSKIKDRLPGKTLVFSMDRYYRPFSHLDDDERREVNFDHPDSLDWELMIQHLEKLRDGESVEIPEYSFEENTRVGSTEQHPREIILVEGIHALQESELNRMMDLKIFLDPEPEIRAVRRMKRDIVKRNRDPEFAARQFIETTHPAHHSHVEPTKEKADIILESAEIDRFIQKVIETQRTTSELTAEKILS